MNPTPPSPPLLHPFRFAVLNDLHYTDPRDGPWLQGLIHQINAAPGIELCLVLGDLIENGTPEEMTQAHAILNRLRMPFYTVPGNHDGPPGGPLAAHAVGLETYQQFFPARRNYTFDHRGWQFIALDSTDGSVYDKVPLNPEALDFARQAAARLDPRRPIILFTHFPIAPQVPFALTNGAELLAIFRHLNLRLALGGHYHGRSRNLIDGVELLTNTCASMRRELETGESSRGYLLCNANADATVQTEFIEYRGPA